MSTNPEQERLTRHPSLSIIEDIGRQLLARATYNRRSFGTTDISDMFFYHVGFDRTEAQWIFTRNAEKPVSNRLHVARRYRSLYIDLIKEQDLNTPYKPHRITSTRLSMTSTGSYYFLGSGNTMTAISQDQAFSLNPNEANSAQRIETFRERLMGFVNMAEIMLDFPDTSGPISPQ